MNTAVDDLARCMPHRWFSGYGSPFAGATKESSTTEEILRQKSPLTEEYLVRAQHSAFEHRFWAREEGVDGIVESQIVLRCCRGMCDARHHHEFLVRAWQ